MALEEATYCTRSMFGSKAILLLFGATLGSCVLIENVRERLRKIDAAFCNDETLTNEQIINGMACSRMEQVLLRQFADNWLI